jgi:hypothetical protein
MCDPIVVSTGHVDAPWVTADLAVLNEAAGDVRLDVDLQLLAAEGTCDQKFVWHLRNPTAMRDRRPVETANGEVPPLKRSYCCPLAGAASTEMSARSIPVATDQDHDSSSDVCVALTVWSGAHLCWQ